MGGADAELFAVSAIQPTLKVGCETQHDAARRTDGVTGKESPEIDYFECVAQVLDVGLQVYRVFFVLVEIDAHRSIFREVRIDAAELKIEAINHRLTVFRGVKSWGFIRFEGQPGVVIASRRDPQAREDLIAEADAHRVPLVLRIG